MSKSGPIALMDGPLCPTLRVPQLRPTPTHRHGSFIQSRDRIAAPGRRRDLPRRGHPRDHQGAAAVGRGLRRRLPGRAGVAPARRDGAGQALPGRAGRARRGLRQRGVGRGDARRVDPLPAARRRHLEVDRRHQRRRRRAVQPVVARRHGRRADRRRRGLRRGRQRDPGAHARLRAEVDACACSIRGPTWACMVRMVEEGFALVGGLQHAGDPGAAHPRLPRARQLRVPRTTSRRPFPPAR